MLCTSLRFCTLAYLLVQRKAMFTRVFGTFLKGVFLFCTNLPILALFLFASAKKRNICEGVWHIFKGHFLLLYQFNGQIKSSRSGNESFLTCFRFLSSHTTVRAVRHTAVPYLHILCRAFTFLYTFCKTPLLPYFRNTSYRLGKRVPLRTSSY